MTSPTEDVKLLELTTAPTVAVIVMFAEPLNEAEPVTSPPSAIVRAVVKVAADPVVFWLPVVLTPGKLIFAEPLKLTPPIVLAFCNVVAVVALPLNPADTVPTTNVFVLGL
jgi:hypothetical protein